jgi:hypothetical protein
MNCAGDARETDPVAQPFEAAVSRVSEPAALSPNPIAIDQPFIGRGLIMPWTLKLRAPQPAFAASDLETLPEPTPAPPAESSTPSEFRIDAQRCANLGIIPHRHKRDSRE